MSNHITFQTTKFSNLNEALEVTEETFGYRIYDDHEQIYNNVMEKSDLPTTPEEALDIIEESHDDMYDFIVNHKSGFFFNGEFIPVNEKGKIVKE